MRLVAIAVLALAIAACGGDDDGAAQPMSYTFYQGRPATKRRAVTTALFLLRRSLLARPHP